MLPIWIDEGIVDLVQAIAALDEGIETEYSCQGGDRMDAEWEDYRDAYVSFIHHDGAVALAHFCDVIDGALRDVPVGWSLEMKWSKFYDDEVDELFYRAVNARLGVEMRAENDLTPIKLVTTALCEIDLDSE